MDSHHDSTCKSRQYVNGPCDCEVGYEEEHDSGWTSGLAEGQMVERARIVAEARRRAAEAPAGGDMLTELAEWAEGT